MLVAVLFRSDASLTPIASDDAQHYFTQSRWSGKSLQASEDHASKGQRPPASAGKKKLRAGSPQQFKSHMNFHSNDGSCPILHTESRIKNLQSMGFIKRHL